MGRIGLVVSDFIMSFLWIGSGALIKVFVHKGLGLRQETSGEVIKGVLGILHMFLFAFLTKLTKGAAYNPLTVLAAAVSGDFSLFLLFFNVGARIPAQVSLFCYWNKKCFVLGLNSDWVPIVLV